MAVLQSALDALTAEAELVEPADGSVRCLACAHRCRIREGRRGVCRVRFNLNGSLRMPWGYVAGMQLDPVEKKPFFHLLPGAAALTFGMLGCNFHCAFCQNWISSQALRDPDASLGGWSVTKMSEGEIAKAAVEHGADLVISSYNEPLITAEWGAAIFRAARACGLRTAIVSNGYATLEALAYLRPVLDAVKIDLKSMRDSTYRKLGGVLKNTLDTIARAKEMGFWVEVVTLIIPGWNDEPAELWEAARFLRSVSADIPWHVTGFHPDYRALEHRATQPGDLQRAAEIGLEAGLRFVYAGNLPGRVERMEDTACPGCGGVSIRRRGYQIVENRLKTGGKCPDCGEILAGIWQ